MTGLSLEGSVLDLGNLAKFVSLNCSWKIWQNFLFFLEGCRYPLWHKELRVGGWLIKGNGKFILKRWFFASIFYERADQLVNLSNKPKGYTWFTCLTNYSQKIDRIIGIIWNGEKKVRFRFKKNPKKSSHFFHSIIKALKSFYLPQNFFFSSLSCSNNFDFQCQKEIFILSQTSRKKKHLFNPEFTIFSARLIERKRRKTFCLFIIKNRKFPKGKKAYMRIKDWIIIFLFVKYKKPELLQNEKSKIFLLSWNHKFPS